MTEAVGSDAPSCVVSRQHPFEVGVLPLDRKHGIIEPRGDVGLLGRLLEVAPSGLFGDPKDIGRDVLITVL